MARTSRHAPLPLPLPVEPDPLLLPRRLTRVQMAELHRHYYGPISPRTLEAAPLAYQRLPGGPAVYSTVDFIAWAEARLAASPVIRGGKRRSIEAEAA